MDPGMAQRIRWGSSRILMYGSLICFSDDGFTDNYLFATVANVDRDEIRKSK